MTKRTTPIRYRARIGICLLLALLMTLVVLTWQAWRQARLDNALIVALRHHDDASAITLLNQGANARLSIPLEDVPPPTFWQILRSRFSGKSSPQADGASCLLMALGIREATRLHIVGEELPSAPPENLPLVEALLAHGADVNVRGAQDHTPLLLASKWKYAAIARLLLAHNSNVNAADEGGVTVLMHAVVGDTVMDEATLTLFLQHGAQINAHDGDGDTALIHSFAYGYRHDFAAMNFLLTHGADINSKGRSGNTALLYAVDNRDLPVVRFLLEHHADVNIRNDAGWTPLRAAGDREGGARDPELCALLKRYGAKD